MTEAAAAYRPSSRQGSPVPRRQLGTLSVNQRSYSRLSSSKGVFGDESPLMSPMPYYPRHRSVTFADDRSGAREERPNYNGTYSASAPVSPVRQPSPPPVSILKPTSSFPHEEYNGAAPASPVAAAAAAASAPSAALARRDPTAAAAGERTSPVPRRGRSHSQQRLKARRREAELHQSFYDDSIVEDFVLKAKTELAEEEAEQRRVQEQLKAEQVKARRAERRVSVAMEKLSEVQHAKQMLMAAPAQRHASVTPSPPRQLPDTSKRNSSLLRELEEDPNPEVQETLKELARQSLIRKQQTAQAAAQQRRRSLPIVSEDALAVSDSAEEEADDADEADRRKRARLEKIVSRLLEKKAKSKSKHSVLVIDLPDSDSDADGDDNANDAASDDGEEAEECELRKRMRGRSAKSRSVGLASEATLVASTKAASRKPSAKRAASSRRRNASVVPDLGDSLLFEEQQPILLQRRQHKRPSPTRSISHIDIEGDDDMFGSESSVERVVRRPPRATHAPATTATATRARRTTTATASARRVAGTAEAPSSLAHTGVRWRTAAAPTVREESPTPAAPAAPRARRAAPTRADPNDPMAVFFEAAFPSPSKFEEMMMQAGGLPETRRGGGGGGAGRGNGRQPNLVLPSSISRRR